MRVHRFKISETRYFQNVFKLIKLLLVLIELILTNTCYIDINFIILNSCFLKIKNYKVNTYITFT